MWRRPKALSQARRVNQASLVVDALPATLLWWRSTVAIQPQGVVQLAPTASSWSWRDAAVLVLPLAAALICAIQTLAIDRAAHSGEWRHQHRGTTAGLYAIPVLRCWALTRARLARLRSAQRWTPVTISSNGSSPATQAITRPSMPKASPLCSG